MAASPNAFAPPPWKAASLPLVRLLGPAFLLVCFFPWIGPIKLGTDIQPYALILGSVICLSVVMNAPLPRAFLWFGLPICVALCYLILAGFSFPAIRSAAGYVGQAILCIASYMYYRSKRDSPAFFYGVLCAYLVAGLVQLYLDPNFFQFLLSREAGYAGFQGRGVESLAAEPTFLGIHMLILALYCWVSPDLKSSDRYGIAILAVGIAVFISRSSTVLLFLSLFLIVRSGSILRIAFASRHGMLWAFATLIAFLALASLIPTENVRFFDLLSLVWESPQLVIIADQSLNTRMFDVFFSLLGFLEHPLLGNGFVRWTAFLAESANVYPIANYGTGDYFRISSFFGTILFELGLSAAPIIWLLARSAQIYRGHTGVSTGFQLAFLGLLLIQSVPITYPLVPLYIGRAFALRIR